MFNALNYQSPTVNLAQKLNIKKGVMHLIAFSYEAA